MMYFLQSQGKSWEVSSDENSIGINEQVLRFLQRFTEILLQQRFMI